MALSRLTNRIPALVVVLSALALTSCGKPSAPAADVQQIPPVKTADTTFGATPNPIVVTDGTGLGLTTLSWTTTKTKLMDIRVSSPGGALLGTVSPSGTTDTGKWVRDGMQFYLQDAKAANRTDASATLAVLTVKVIQR